MTLVTWLPRDYWRMTERQRQQWRNATKYLRMPRPNAPNGIWVADSGTPTPGWGLPNKEAA